MTTRHVDELGRRAAEEARAAVCPVVEARRAANPAPSRRRWAPVAAALTLAVVVGAVALWQRDTPTRVATGPPVASPTTVAPPGSAPDPIPSPIATGTTREGQSWRLLIGGPSSDLCLAVTVGRGIVPTVCGAVPWFPTFHADVRTSLLAFGMVPADIVEVEASGVRVPVISAPGGPYYVIELPDRQRPAEIVGYRADGTFQRFAVP